ncbi:hypothetical protein PVAND_004010 [Polypedilum vanderplanki]|uniref:Tudor domain-containing protein n=1 Tax=Polypedilum vanderplanki TaxID=319348 RepID=A0A9J6BVR8_POLVA|nr:hypothetical protein PVAND_004010 [Polypedilum vanderplanki]
MSNTLYTKSKNSTEHDDIWDDSLLIKAYEESVKLQNEEIAKKLAMKTNKKTESGKEESSSITNEEYKIGSFVRSTYKDGVDYEAEILSINENGTALIKYIGYNNEERVKVEDLANSWGEEYREQQKVDAENDNAASSNGDDANTQEEDLHNFVLNKSKKLQDKLPIPPMPPMPPGMFENSKDAEYMSAMLMSWYMSGYYTGLYQGRKEIISQQEDKSNKEFVKQDRKRQRRHNSNVNNEK